MIVNQLPIGMLFSRPCRAFNFHFRNSHDAIEAFSTLKIKLGVYGIILYGIIFHYSHNPCGFWAKWNYSV